MTDKEKKAIDELWHFDCAYNREIKIVLNLIEKQFKEIEELKETLKCTQNSWYEDTIKIEEMKKQIDLDNECEIALNNRIMDLENADKKWEDKIKAKIEEVSNGTFDAKIVLQSLLDYKKGE